MPPSTAGTILTEERLRAFCKCPKFYTFGGETKLSVEDQLMRFAVEYLTTSLIRKPSTDPYRLFTKALLRGMKHENISTQYLDAQLDKFVRDGSKWLAQYFTLFPPANYHMIRGALPFRAKVHKTPIDLRVSALLRSTQYQTLHAVTFSPYRTRHDMANDPTVLLKLNFFRDFVKPHPTGRARSCLHILHHGTSGAFDYTKIYSNEIEHRYKKQVESVVKLLEEGLTMPIVPCPHACPYKQRCTPRIFNV